MRRNKDREVPRPGGSSLTPVDVQQVQFRLAFRGYNEGDVDAFLDRVTEDLTARIEERERLLRRVGTGGGELDPSILADARSEADAIIAARPHALVIIDSPDFTHRVAKRVRARAPDIPIIDYVSPTVWAWRPGRARAMRAYVDHVMALLPFEPEAHRRLGGPECSYVGHPLVERIGDLRAPAAEAAVRVLRGLPVPKEIILPVEIVDASNFAPWDRPIEERARPAWSAVVTDARYASPTA